MNFDSALKFLIMAYAGVIVLAGLAMVIVAGAMWKGFVRVVWRLK